MQRSVVAGFGHMDGQGSGAPPRCGSIPACNLSDLDHTLRVLGLTLFGAGVVTTLLGVALGRFASARSLRPLAAVSRAAGSIAVASSTPGSTPRRPTPTSRG